MIETMLERLERLIKDVNGITGFVFSSKCKTSDGLICTLDEIRVTKDECPECLTLAEYADSEVTKEVLHNLNLVESNKFLYSNMENVAIRCDTIARIWVELDYNEVNDAEAPTPLPSEN